MCAPVLCLTLNSFVYLYHTLSSQIVKSYRLFMYHFVPNLIFMFCGHVFAYVCFFFFLSLWTMLNLHTSRLAFNRCRLHNQHPTNQGIGTSLGACKTGHLWFLIISFSAGMCTLHDWFQSKNWTYMLYAIYAIPICWTYITEPKYWTSISEHIQEVWLIFVKMHC